MKPMNFGENAQRKVLLAVQKVCYNNHMEKSVF